MTSFIVRDAPCTYISPGAMMCLRDEGPLAKIGGDEYGSEEEEEDRDRMGSNHSRDNKDSRVFHGVSGRKEGQQTAAGGRNILDKRNSDSAYSSFGRAWKMNENDEGTSTHSSSVPIDPSTQVPVFVVPTDMEFVVSGDFPDGRKVMTLYNPYEYPFEYKLLCTATEHFVIEPPCGRVNAKHLVDITIRGRPSLMPNAIHRVRIDLMRVGRNELLGSRIVPIRTVAFATQPSMGGDQSGVFNRIGGDGRRMDGGREGRGVGRRMGEKAANDHRPDVRIVNEPAAAPVNLSLIIIVSALCMLALCLPIQKEVTVAESIIPLYLHISETQRVVAAFILGVCSVLILQPAHNNNR